MDKQQAAKAQETLSILTGQPLRFLFRCMDMVCLQFGDIIEKSVMSIDESGKPTRAKERAGSYSLHIQSIYRMTCGYEIVFAKTDLYQPSLEALDKLGLQIDDDVPDDFDCSVLGNNRLDELIQSKFTSLEDFVVDSVSVNRFGDMHIKFHNGFAFQTVIDASGPEECWRFFHAVEGSHLVITAYGIDSDE
jgi:hypothetical protein